MAIAKITTDYTGRKKDISILQYPDASKPEAQDVSPKFGKTPRFCAGPQKLVQRYTIILLTNLTSQINYPDFGTKFLYTLKAGISPTDKLMARQIFQLASYSTVNTLKAYQVSTFVPPDESVKSAVLRSISLYGGYVSFDVVITTDAGSSIDFLVPLPI
jgi:hypothetical protein